MSSSSAPSPFILTARDIAYDNSASGLGAENLQDAIDEIAGVAGENFTVVTSHSNPWSGYPIPDSVGTAYGAVSTNDYGPSAAFTGTITPGEFVWYSGLAFGFVYDGETANTWALLFVNGAGDADPIKVTVPGLSLPLYTLDAEYATVVGGDAFIWDLGGTPVPDEWKGENTLTMTLEYLE